MLADRQSGLVIVGSFSFLHEADVARALLDSYGLESWLLDELQIQQRWHLASALGGVKLAVAPGDAPRALEILAVDHSDALQEIPENELPAAPDEGCHACGSGELLVTRTLRSPGPLGWLTSIFFFFLGALVPRRTIEHRYECASCGRSWSAAETR